MISPARKERPGVRTRRLVVFVALMGALASVAACAATTRTPSLQRGTTVLTSDMQVVVQMNCPASADCSSSAALQKERDALLSRARDGLGVAGATVTQTDATHFQVNLPGYADTQVAAKALTDPGVVEFLDTEDVAFPVGATVAEGKYPLIAPAAQIDPSSVQAEPDPSATRVFVVTFEFSGSAHDRFTSFTGSHIGSYLTITVDGRVVESATIQSRIAGLGEISGLASEADAVVLATYLKTKPLPEPVKLVSTNVVVPTAG